MNISPVRIGFDVPPFNYEYVLTVGRNSGQAADARADLYEEIGGIVVVPMKFRYFLPHLDLHGAQLVLDRHTEMNRVLEARDSGVHEFLGKPLSASSLFSRIRAIIENPRDFVHTSLYFGPDRRRPQTAAYTGPERRKTKLEAQPAASGGKDLNSDGIEAVLNG